MASYYVKAIKITITILFISLVDTIIMSSQEDERSDHNEQRICGISIDVRLIPCKVACYLFHSASGCITSFVNVFLVSIGLTASEAGFISGYMLRRFNNSGTMLGSFG